MSTNFPKPAELPEGGEGGGGTRLRPRPGGIGGPHELPPFEFTGSFRNLLQEVFSLRNRVHSIENDMLATRLGGTFSTVGGPNELPAELGDGGGGVIFRPPKEIAELPAFDRTLAAIGTLTDRLTTLEKSVQTLSTRVEALKR